MSCSNRRGLRALIAHAASGRARTLVSTVSIRAREPRSRARCAPRSNAGSDHEHGPYFAVKFAKCDEREGLLNSQESRELAGELASPMIVAVEPERSLHGKCHWQSQQINKVVGWKRLQKETKAATSPLSSWWLITKGRADR